MIKNLYLSCLITSALGAQEFSNTDFNAEILVVEENQVHVISSFNEIDYFSTYSHSSELIWEIPFSSHILSWQKKDDSSLYIFSKSRNGLIFYLSCVEALTGKLIWEKPIFSPEMSSSLQKP